jgi:hypothetical protein
VVTAQCPLCQATFDASPPAPAHRTAAPESTTALLVEPNEDSAEFDFDPDETPQARADRRAIRAAAGWLKATGALGLSQLMLCGCFDLFEVRRGPADANPVRTALILLAVRLIALMVVWSAAESFARRRSRTHVTVGAVTALLLGAYMLYRALPGLLHLIDFVVPLAGPMNPNDAIGRAIYGVFAAAVGLTGVVGAVRTFVVLRRPAVRAQFAR